jgi:hypothetical protein
MTTPSQPGWRVRNRGRFVIRLTRLFCDDPPRFNLMRRPWRCNSGRTANTATRTCRRTRSKRASALTNARSARIAPRTGFITSVQTAAVLLSRGRSGRPRNGGLDYRLRSGRRRTSGCISLTVSTISPSIRRAFGISRQKSVERRQRLVMPGLTRASILRKKAGSPGQAQR